jgi:hypothetical protein
MPSPAELASKFASFPGGHQVQEVCKSGQGVAQCRYLVEHASSTGTRSYCRKASSYERDRIDTAVAQGECEAQGDNCPGTLRFIMDNQDLLMGNRTVHHEAGEDTPGTFRGITRRNGIVNVEGIGFTEESADVSITPEGITFSARYIGYATVFFDKPQEPQE